LSLEGYGIGTAFLWHGRPLKKARNGVHLNLGGHHRLKRRCQEGVLPGRLLLIAVGIALLLFQWLLQHHCSFE
jgi:hypothetical protein